MVLFQTLNEEEMLLLRGRYSNNDLFRHWSPVLCEMERAYGCRDAISLWACAEQCLNRLRSVSRHRETEIDYILRELLKETDVTTAVTVMFIVLIRLMNAVKVGQEDAFFDNEPMCIAIMRIMRTNETYKPIFSTIEKLFFGRKIGFDLKPVVIQPSDPMHETLTLDDMAEEAREDMEEVIENVIKHTEPLQIYWGEEAFARWRKLWNDICLDAKLFTLLKRTEPRKSAWGLNEKMVCNVIGIFNSKLEKPENVVKINNCLVPAKNRRNYISNTRFTPDTNCAFNKQEDLYSSVMTIIENNLRQA